MNFETRGKYREALKAYREVKKAIDHLESDHFQTSSEEDRMRTLRDYSSNLDVWRSQIPEKLHSSIHSLNRLQLELQLYVE